MDLSQTIATIRERRNAGTEQALLMLDMAPLSDTDNKYSLLSTAAGSLHDPAVISKWMELLAAETDTRLKAAMLQRLAAVDLQQIPDKQGFADLLAVSLQQDESRDIILPLLGRLSLTYAPARERLIAFYQQQQNADVNRQILSWLLIPVHATEADLAFYHSLLDSTDTDDKLLLLNRLLLRDQLEPALLAQQLQPATPDVIKEMVLRFCFDRSTVPEAALCTLVRSDKNPLLRKWSIQLLAVHGVSDNDVLDTLLHALREDPDPAVRQAAMSVFAYSLTLTPDTIRHLTQCLQTEKHIAVALQLLQLLAPYTEKNEALADALWQLPDRDVPLDLAVAVYDILGRLVPVKPTLLEKFMTAYEKEQHDACKAIILKAITSAMNTGDTWNRFYLRALEAPSTAIRSWAVQAILYLPLTPENNATIAAAAPVLLHKELPQQQQRLLARKISFIPQLSAAAVQVFGKLADHSNDQELQQLATKVQEKAIAHNGGAQINWEQWLHKAEVTRDLSGIFPHLWLFYDDNPEMANKVLFAAINPANSNSLYQSGVTDIEILNFLSVKAGINDDMSRYALNQLLHTDLGNESKFKWYLLILKSNPANAELREGLWQLLEKRGRYINMIQLDELLRIIWKAQLENVFRQHLQQQTTAAGVVPYLQYLEANNTWEPAPALLKIAAQLPGMPEDNSFKDALQRSCRAAGMDIDDLLRSVAPPVAPEAAGPGFAD
ncbi:HEAT repeat domain-containing protein [Chitinophaga qingshengii]|uniref:HEAT repeat domain-containing protein n=1 Tax=Chitinophaga qingshengii TaxID=1569794 RepID=A0ABR7TWU8_9BACT|nr:HEAT repeat domain-containing protein [Chitinophaga qingshengii]MBC9934955.1 HEAT repeat domain-containing protein [Chitinophaga qingshengii]